MKPERRYLGAGIGAVVAAVIGGAIALALAAAFGLVGTNKTETQTVSVTESPSSFTQPSKPAKALTVPEIYERDASGVVQVTTTAVVKSTNPFFQTPQTETALGSGFVIDKQGHIVTNYHVIQGATAISVSFSNNENRKATVVGSDPSNDLAVLKVNISPQALTPLTLGDSAAMEVGDQVVAIGNPFGLDRTVTEGIISALNRPLSAPNQFTISNVIQTDAAINHGNSGGPLINDLGQVIGVATAIETGGTSQGNVGIGFAIPSNTVKQVVAQLIKTGKVEHAYLGVLLQPITPQLARTFNLPISDGLLVVRVISGSGAAKAGISGGTRSVIVGGQSYRLGGDIIVSIDGKNVDGSFAKLQEVIAAHKSGDKITLEIYRGKKKMNVTVVLGAQPKTAP
jgi:S1-C subfamily serine protease